MFYLMSAVFALVLGLVDGLVGFSGVGEDSLLVNLYILAIYLPAISAAARRLHDINRSGWWQVVPLANIVMLCLPSDDEANRFGPPPR